MKKAAVVAETPAHKQGHNLLLKTELRRKRMKLGPTDVVVEESPMKFPQGSPVASTLPTSQFLRQSSFYSEKPSRHVSKYAKLEERMTQKVSSPPSQKFDNTYVAGSWLTSPRRITPKALFGSLLSPSPSGKAGTKLARKLDLKSPIRNLGCSASVDFKSPVKVFAGSSASSATVVSPMRPVESSLSQLGLDSPSRNTRSHASTEKHGAQSETTFTQQSEMSASPSSLGRRYSRIMSQSFVAVTSPDFKQHRKHFASGLATRAAISSQSSVGKTPKSRSDACQMPSHSPERAISLSRVHRARPTMYDVSAAETYSEMLGSDTCGVKTASDHSPCLRAKGPASDKRSPKKKCLLANQSPPFSSTVISATQSVQPLDQSVDEAENIYGVGKSEPRLAENNMSHKRKKLSKAVGSKSTVRKRSYSQLYPDSYSSHAEEIASAMFPDVCGGNQSEQSTLFNTLSFGCDVETPDGTRTEVLGQEEKLNSDVFRHLGSSGVESESSSNDVDLMIARKHLLDRKHSSGFQSLGHISETECCPSPVFPSILNEAVADASDQSGPHTSRNSVSTSPVFGKKQTQSFSGESPCLSLSGSDHKRTPVAGCAKSFSPDVSQHSIAHLMTSPLLGGSEALQQTSRSRSSTRRCLDPQMYQSGKHSSSKSRDEDN